MNAFQAAENEVAAFFGSLSAEEFVLREGDAWTPAEHLVHINTSLSAVARGFGINRWLLRLRFGRPRQPSRRFEALVDDYNARLRAGAGASGRYVPPGEVLTGDERDRRRQELLERWQRVNARMRAALDHWSERDLERIRLPHPILGLITAREMAFFAIHHGPHHVTAAMRRLPRFR